MRRSNAIAIVLVLLATAAISAYAQVPVNTVPTVAKESQCYPCHSDGQYGPAIQTMHLIHGPDELVIPLGETGMLSAGVENAWVAEMREISGVVDLTNAPGLLFASEKEPSKLDEFGQVPLGLESGERTGTTRHTFMVEPGATEVIISAGPDPASPTAATANFGLRIWTGGKDPESDASILRDEAGPGETEVWQLSGLQDIADLGTGEWNIDVIVRTVAGNPTDSNPLGPLSQDYVLSAAADFKGLDIPQQFVSVDDILPSKLEAPGSLAYLDWIIFADTLPSGPGTLTIEVIPIHHYEHGSTTISQYDDWRVTKTITMQVVPDPDNNAIKIRSEGVADLPDVVETFNWTVLSEIVGYISAVLILASIYTGGMFGKASRRQLNAVFGTAKRRVAFHNFLSYGILLAALIHMVVFLVESIFDWTVGIIWGGVAILAMIGLGVTGALQVPIIRKWNYAVWRWSHFYLAIGSIVFTLVHILLDGVHFVDLQDSIGWSNPFTREG